MSDNFLDILAQATTFQDLEAAWIAQICRAFAIPIGTYDWGARWVFQHGPSLTFTIGNRDDGWRDLPYLPPEFVSRYPVHAIHHPTVAASFYVTGADSVAVSSALNAINADARLCIALGFSLQVLRGHVSCAIARSVLHSGTPLLLIDAAGFVHHQSPTVGAALGAANATVRPRDSFLLWENTTSKLVFDTMLERVFALRKRQVAYIDDTMFTVTPSHAVDPLPLATVMVRSLFDFSLVDVTELAEALSLTKAQAKLAQALVGGCDLEDYARENQLTMRGVKWHLSGLMQRMECRRRDQLVGKLTRLMG